MFPALSPMDVHPAPVRRASLISWDLARDIVGLVHELHRRPDLKHRELLVHVAWRMVGNQLTSCVAPHACPSISQLVGPVIPVSEHPSQLETAHELAILITGFGRREGQIDLLFIPGDSPDPVNLLFAAASDNIECLAS